MSTDAPATRLLDLPVDIIYCILPYLEVPEFVALSSTCKALHNPDLSQYARYWSTAVRTTFRVPNQPVVANDGARWQKMYRRLLTQSKVYTWGSNGKNCLGHSIVTSEQLESAPPALRRRLAQRSRHVSWPTEMEHMEDIGVVADMQCGGWSTNLLSSKGGLYSVGVLDGLQFRHGRMAFTQRSHATPTRLRYPAGLPHPCERYEPAAAVKQFSAGRAHILAVSDLGRIWSWSDIDRAAYNVKFLNIELKEKANENEVGHVRRVVGGWNKSAALINGAGIVLWDPLQRDPDTEETEEDAVLVLETAVVPLTAYRQPRVDASSSHTQQDGQEIGEVESFICLEDYVLFNTHIGKVFAAKITWSNREQSISTPTEIPLSPPTDEDVSQEEAHQPLFASDVQGSFRSFAIFDQSGAVLTGHQDMLNAFFQNTTSSIPPLKRIPALQNSGVISIAFGDYHFHALHASGHITSYGNEPQGCGALGLGGQGIAEGRLRGLRFAGIAGDAQLVPHAYTTGRRVWFEKEKKEWITFLTSGGADPEEARERMRMCQEPSVQGEVSEWIEMEGRAWEQRFNGDGDSKEVEENKEVGGGEATSQESVVDDDGLGTYFALNVTAAGWHSGALVLVNEDMAAATRAKCLVKPSPPTNKTGKEEDAEEDDDDEEDAEGPPQQEQQQQQQQQQEQGEASTAPLLNRTASYVADTVRWLGSMTISPAQRPLTAATTAEGEDESDGGARRTATHPQRIRRLRRLPPTMPGRRDPANPNAFIHPTNHGAAAEDGTPYVWRDEVFPRLRLSDGREMPGRVEFSGWRSGDGRAPVWDLGYAV